MLLGTLLFSVGDGAHRHPWIKELEKPVVGIRVRGLRVTES